MDNELNGIDTSLIKSCKRIRELAKLGRITLNTNNHISRLNKHLFDYIEYCGSDIKKIKTILQRIKYNLAIKYNLELQ